MTGPARSPGPGANEPTVESRVLYRGRILNVREDVVKMASGRLARREIVEHSDAVCLVPVDSNGNVLLVRQYRKPIETFLLEAPAGMVERGEDLGAAALRELREETGHTARKLEPLAQFWLAPGYDTEKMHSYLATDLERAPLSPDEDEDLQVVRVPLSGVEELVRHGEIQDAKSIVSLLLALQRLGAGRDPGG